MTAKFFDLDDDDNPLNGTTLATGTDVRYIFERLHGRRPFMFQLQFADGCKLDVGFAEEMGCVQHTPSDGMPPYRMATTTSSPRQGQGDTEFSVGGTATPIDNRYCIPLRSVQLILTAFLDSRQLPSGIAWESV